MAKNILAGIIFLFYIIGLPYYFFNSVDESIILKVKIGSFLLYFLGALASFLFGIFLFASDTSNWQGILKAFGLNVLVILFTALMVIIGLFWAKIDGLIMGIADGMALSLLAFLSGHFFEILLRYEPKNKLGKKIHYTLVI